MIYLGKTEKDIVDSAGGLGQSRTDTSLRTLDFESPVCTRQLHKNTNAFRVPLSHRWHSGVTRRVNSCGSCRIFMVRNPADELRFHGPPTDTFS